MLYYENNQWHICPYKAKYTTHGEPQEKYTADKKWWKNFVNKWWHHESLHFEPVNPTSAQLARLNEINNADIPQGFISDASAYVEYGYVQNKNSSHFSGFSDQQDAFDKFIGEKVQEIETERIKRTNLMPYTTPDGAEVQIKIAEEPPSKPRQTWLAGASARAIAAKVKSESMTEDLIAANDSRHSMSEDDWITLGEALHQWIKDHIDVADEHVANIMALDTVEDVKAYDITTNPEWPS